MSDQVEFLAPWEAVTRAPSNLEQELLREISPAHPLNGCRPLAIARRGDNDDVLFRLEGTAEPYAVVHLTWTGRPENSGVWPNTRFYTSLKDWQDRCMQPEADEWHRESSADSEEVQSPNDGQ
ncbi:hypothetical protein [Planctomyces sp. SH-PL14]|uniref:hypothetical protein n=1 Tax=Planctomyces sp. SH-PL14 TaxID=1632864 RepID=UPI00078BD447|nr:hypothetical protein [Planctomyces sp. SH-PL14]AMV19331.1 hypothetical protein VT03_15675 [Planctomyces sp. SH-PL14]